MSRKPTLSRLTTHRECYMYNNLLLQILMNAAKRRGGIIVETRQSVTIHWDHFSAFVGKVLASNTLKENVMVSVTHSPYKTVERTFHKLLQLY